MLSQMKYSLLVKLKNPALMFWPFVFPIALATLMYFAVGQMNRADFETVPAALVLEDESESGRAFLEYLDALGEDSGLIEVKEMTEEEALDALEKGEAEGIFYAGEEAALTVSGNGFPESILQSVLSSWQSGKTASEDIEKLHPEGMAAAVEKMQQYDNAVKQVSLGGKTMDGNVLVFYALIGMACLYGCFIGFNCALWLQANLTALAARRCTAPVRRLQLIFTEFFSAFLIHFADMLVLLVYMKYVLRLEFTGSNLEMAVLVLAGSMFGVALGIFVGSIGKLREGPKIGILLAISMGLSFFAGLMDGSVKHIIDNYAPVLNRLNPAALISDALYSLNVYNMPERYLTDMAVLSVLSVLMVAGAFLIVRRERYDSI